MHSIPVCWDRIQMGVNVKILICSIWKYIHLHADGSIAEARYAREHPAVGIYSMLCSQDRKTRGCQKY
jgi:hypothetical protein